MIVCDICKKLDGRSAGPLSLRLSLCLDRDKPTNGKPLIQRDKIPQLDLCEGCGSKLASEIANIIRRVPGSDQDDFEDSFDA